MSARTDVNLLNDLAVIAIRNKDYRKARKLLESAAVINQKPEVLNNLGIVYQNEGNNTQAKDMYTKASIKNEAKYNLGMLLLKDKEYNKAIPYLKAVAAARVKDVQVMAVALQKAIQLDPQLKERASTDKEFYPYAQESIYLDIVD